MISLKFVPKFPINNILALVQIMPWHWPGNETLSEPMMVCLSTNICITQPQWVKYTQQTPHSLYKKLFCDLTYSSWVQNVIYFCHLSLSTLYNKGLSSLRKIIRLYGENFKGIKRIFSRPGWKMLKVGMLPPCMPAKLINLERSHIVIESMFSQSICLISFTEFWHLNHCSLMTLNGVIHLGQHWLR